MKNLERGKYSIAKPVFKEYATSDSHFSFPAKLSLGVIALSEGLNKHNSDGAYHLDEAYSWYNAAFNEGASENIPDEYKTSLDDGSVQHALGYLCELGAGESSINVKEENEHCSVRWYKLAAEKEHAVSLARLGHIYFLGIYQTKSNLELANIYFDAALSEPNFENPLIQAEASFIKATLIIKQSGTD